MTTLFTFPNTWLSDLVNLVYPQCCTACGKQLQHEETLICLTCEYDLPQTNYHNDPENPIAKRFWGRIPLAHAVSFLHFSRGGRTQRLLHALKYKGQQDIGMYLGKMYGRILAQQSIFKEVDIILPIPLHPKKQARRGYNQSDSFAQGLSETLGVDWSPTVLERVIFTNTQTKKGVLDRWTNVENIFAVREATLIAGQHVLLVDDVITSGSTMEACAQQILKVEGTRVSVASIACA